MSIEAVSIGSIQKAKARFSPRTIELARAGISGGQRTAAPTGHFMISGHHKRGFYLMPQSFNHSLTQTLLAQPTPSLTHPHTPTIFSLLLLSPFSRPNVRRGPPPPPPANETASPITPRSILLL